MKPQKKYTAVVEDEEIHEIEIDNSFIEFYKKETGHRRVTRDGLSKFIERLSKFFCLH